MSTLSSDKVQRCNITSDILDNVSDHYPIKTIYSIKIESNDNKPINLSQKFPRFDWSQNKLCQEYYNCLKELEHELINIPIENIVNQDSAKTSKPSQ